MSTEQRLIDALVVEAKAHGIADWRLTNSTARLDALNRIENQRDELKAEVEKRRAEHRKAEPKLRELYQAADALWREVNLHPKSNTAQRGTLMLRLHAALSAAYDHVDMIPF